MPPRTQRNEFLASMADARDPLNKAVSEDRQNLADELKEVLDSLSQFDQSSIRGMLYRVPIPNGKWDWIQDVFPPFDMAQIMHSLKEEIGGGDYVLKIMADSKPRKNLHFSIYGKKNSSDALMVPNNNGEQNMSFMQMLLAQQADARRDAQESNDRMMTVMQQSNQTSMQMMMAMMTAMAGSREKVSDLLPVFAAMQANNKGGGFKETLEALVVAKDLFAGGGGDKDEAPGFDADNVVGSLVRMAGPVASAISRAVGRGGQAQPNPAAVDYTGAEPEPVAPLMMPGPAPQPAIAPPGVPRDTIDAAGYGPSRFPLLEAVRDEVVFMFAKAYHPRTAAAAIYDRVVDLGVTEDQLGELVLAFTSSPDVLGELAAAGIDLRARPDWAHAFFSELVACHADAHDGGFDDADEEPAADALGRTDDPAG